MKYKPLISVIIPSYNRLTLLVRAVESVIDQNYPNIEIIVVDDASDVDIKSALRKYPKVKLIENAENKGPCYSRNKGLYDANGYYINFLDDDDILLPGKLEKQVERFRQSEDEKLGMVTCHLVDERSGKPLIKYNRVRGNIYKQLLDRFAVSGTETLLFKTEAVKKIGGFDEELESSQEYDLLIRLAEYYTIDYVDQVLTRKFRSSNQINTNFDKKLQGARHLYSKHEIRFRKMGFGYLIKKKIKLQILLIRFFTGKIFGEKVYRMLLRD